MPTPKFPPQKGAGASPHPSIRLSPRLAHIQEMLNAAAESERMTRLVDYLEDLRREFDATAAELKTLGFCAPCYLSEQDDGDDHDCVEDEW
jgi:hypothetical protein